MGCRSRLWSSLSAGCFFVSYLVDACVADAGGFADCAGAEGVCVQDCLAPFAVSFCAALGRASKSFALSHLSIFEWFLEYSIESFTKFRLARLHDKGPYHQA